MMIAQCKGKDLNKVPASKLIKDGWYLTKKYDGNYVQIHKSPTEVRFFTSGGKEFYIPEIAEELLNLSTDSFILECEYIGRSQGNLGDRTKACKLTTYRTEFEKDQVSRAHEDERFIAFDIIVPFATYPERERALSRFKLGHYIKKAIVFGPLSLEEANDTARSYIKQGAEGVYLKHKSHEQLAGKRVNTAIKLKLRPTADLICIDIVPGEGKYEGLIGSLILKDNLGRLVSVGSGLSDSDRSKRPEDFTGKIIEIEYEQIIDTYIQPTFIAIREDKEESD